MWFQDVGVEAPGRERAREEKSRVSEQASENGM